MGALISLAEYENSLPRPDMDFLDGVLVERLWGEMPHALTVGRLLTELDAPLDGIALALPSLRVRIRTNWIRVADVCVLRKGSRRAGFFDPPLACIEVLSEFETFEALVTRCLDYVSISVPCVWIIDPLERAAFDVVRSIWHRDADECLEFVSGVSLPLANVIRED